MVVLANAVEPAKNLAQNLGIVLRCEGPITTTIVKNSEKIFNLSNQIEIRLFLEKSYKHNQKYMNIVKLKQKTH